ncbi:sensor domain-containing diguanylate cyclase [Oxalobacter paraformigenes]|nr:GGDEF domain-containing protein [Oxalobacter paraformigenes]
MSGNTSFPSMENVLETLVLADYEIVFRMDGRTGEYRKILAKPAVGSLYPDSGILGDEACLKYMASVYPKDRILLRTEMSPERLAETAKTGHRKIVSYRRRDPGGRLLYRKAVIVPVPDRTGFVCAIHDTTEEMRLRRENDRNLRMKDEGIRFIVENMCENFIIADTETHECTTYTNREGNISCKSRFDEQIDWFAENMVVPEERAYYRRYFDIDTLTGRIAEEGICRMTCSVIYKNDRRTFAITATLIDDPGKNEKPPFLFLCAQDITSIKRMKETNQLLLFHNQHDKLTGLLNRAAAEKRIREQLYAGSGKAGNTFILIDIDRFKHINDRYGHLTGDEVLRLMGESMRKVFRDKDILCRWGGDEFVVFVSGFADEKVMKSRLNILREKTGTFPDQANFPGITLSIGCVCVHREITLNRLFLLADEALYEVKNHGRDGISFKSLP